MKAALHFDSHGAIAQLGERLDRTQEVAGSSPASSMKDLLTQVFCFHLAGELCECRPIALAQFALDLVDQLEV